MVILLFQKSLTPNKPKDIIKLPNNTKYEIKHYISHYVKFTGHHGRQDMERGRNY